MKKHFYFYKNDKLGVWMDPFSSPYGPEEMKEIISRSVKNAKPEDHIEELSLYSAFDMDDKKGEFNFGKSYEFICSLAEFTFKEEGEKNGK